jgi:hypothetical protein
VVLPLQASPQPLRLLMVVLLQQPLPQPKQLPLPLQPLLPLHPWCMAVLRP